MSTKSYNSIRIDYEHDGTTNDIQSTAIKHNATKKSNLPISTEGFATMLASLVVIVLVGAFSKDAISLKTDEHGARIDAFLDDRFDHALDKLMDYHRFSSWSWYNDPLGWGVINEEGDLYVKVPSKSDYWQNTYYPGGRGGYAADNAPFYHTVFDGNFVATVQFTGRYINLYDQAGIMVRLDSNTWMKCGIEYTSGLQHASTVITRGGYSDWSILALGQKRPSGSDPTSIYFRVKRIGGAILTFYSFDGIDFTKIRMGYLADAKRVKIGLVAAAPSPDGDGFEVIFSNFTIHPLSDEDAANEE